MQNMAENKKIHKKELIHMDELNNKEEEQVFESLTSNI